MARKTTSAPPPTEEQKQCIVQQYGKNLSLLDIAKNVGTSRYYVLSTLQDAGKWHGRLTKKKPGPTTGKYFNVDAKNCWI